MKLTRRALLKRTLQVGGSCLLLSALATPVYPLHRIWPRFRKAAREGPAPSYVRLERTGVLKRREEQAYAMLERCTLCPRRCGVNRRKREKGVCQAPVRAVVASYDPHFGEEGPLVGRRGSGTIFFANCNLRCVFCQNWMIAHEGRGREISDEELAGQMLELQGLGCHNINLVTPTHVLPNIIGALRIALRKGLNLPLVYNTSGYERLAILKLLDGIVDIYMPDMKYMDPNMADRYSAEAWDYPQVAQAALLEMHRQVGVLALDERGIATRGLLVRHLVMPNGVSGSEDFVRWIARNLPKSTYLNLLAQYRPAHRAFEFPEIARPVTRQEFRMALTEAQRQDLTNLDPQSLASHRLFH